MSQDNIINVNVPFTKEEHKKLKEVKGDLNWHDFILTLVGVEESNGKQ